MLTLINRTMQISWMNLKNVTHRSGTSLVIVIGVACVVAVLTAVLSMAEGFSAMLAQEGHDDRAIALSSGASGELTSRISREQADLIAASPGVGRASDGSSLVSRETLVIAGLPKAGSDLFGNAAVRGVEPGAFAIRSEFVLTEGRRFTPGARELLVGRQAARLFSGLQVGSHVMLRDSRWTVVGIFSAGGGVHESEIWVDAGTAQGAFRLSGFQSVIMSLVDVAALDTLGQWLARDDRVAVKVQTLRQYFADQTASMAVLIRVLGYCVGVIMAIGAVFGAVNTMQAAVSTRWREIATLRAIGFGALPVVVSVLLEAALLSLVGGLIGAAAAYLVFNGYSAATLGASFSQVMFAFRVTPPLMGQGLAIAICIGLLGGLLPAWRAARLPIITALRISR